MRHLIKPLTQLAGSTLVSRILGFMRDALMAHSFGNGMVTDAFIIAFRLPNLFRSLFAEGAFTSAFVPIYNQMRAKSGEQARQFASNIFWRLLVILAIFSLLAIIFMDKFIAITAVGFTNDPQKFHLTVQLAMITFPYLLCIFCASIGSSLLNSENKYYYGGFAPVLLNITMIFGMLLGIWAFLPLNGYILAVSVFIAGLIQASFIMFGCWRNGITLPKPQWVIDLPQKKFMLTIAPGIMGAGVVQINSVVSDMIATTIGEGAVSYLFYADRLVQLPLAILGIALGTIILQELSKNWANGDTKRAEDNTNNALICAQILAIPAGLALFFLAEPIIIILFERGAFTRANSINVANALQVFALALPLWINSKVLMPVFFARTNTKTPLKIALTTLIINGASAFILKDYFGHVGIAMGSLISALCNNILIFWVISRYEMVAIGPKTIFKIALFILLQIPFIAIYYYIMPLVDLHKLVNLALFMVGVGVLYLPILWFTIKNLRA